MSKEEITKLHAEIDINHINSIRADSFSARILRVAEYYCSIGLYVIPLAKKSKSLPEAKMGINYDSASNKLATIRRWFGVGGKFEGHNIGLACGRSDGIMALDIDLKMKHGTNGSLELERLIEEGNVLPTAPIQITPSGGKHYIFRWKEGCSSSSDKIAVGIDTRGGMEDRFTGHIVAFPSFTDQGTYSWVGGGEIPEAPEWIVEKLGMKNIISRQPNKKDTDTEIPIHQINRMLHAIDIDSVSYDDWVKVGMALKRMYGEDGFDLWDEWSSTGTRRKEGECKFRWKSFSVDEDDSGVGFGTIRFLAIEGGWTPLPGDLSSANQDSAIEEKMMEMNRNYALVRIGKNMQIATFTNNQEGQRVGFLNIGSFSTMMLNSKIFINNKPKNISDIWLSYPLRKQYNDMGVYPNNDNGPGVLNLWNGWSVQPDETKSCTLYLNHIKMILCNGNEDMYEWLLDWMADAVQDSRNVKGTCVVLKGIEGCGKGIWADNFGRLFGKHYVHLIDSERLTSRFNHLMAESIIVFADEVLFPGDRKSANILKGIISERTVTREQKGIDPVEMINMNRVIISSNEDWIVPAGPQSRRYLVLNVSGARANNSKYFSAIAEEMENGGREALLHLLMNRVIKSNIRFAPVTKALIDQRRRSIRHDTISLFLYERLERGNFDTLDSEATVDNVSGWPKQVNKYELFTEYRAWARDTRVSIYDMLSLSMFSESIKSLGFKDSGKYSVVPTADDLRKSISIRQGEHYE